MVMDMRVRARLKCLFLYPKCRATYMCCKVECILSTSFEQLVFMRWRVFGEILVGCCYMYMHIIVDKKDSRQICVPNLAR